MSLPPRHLLPAPPESVRASVQENAEYLARELAGEVWEGEWTASHSRTAFDNACLRAYIDPTDPAILLELELCACTSAAAHAAALTPGSEPIRAPAPGGREVQVARESRPKQLQPLVQWREGVLAAVISRNAGALEVLSRYSAEDLLRLTRLKPPSWYAGETRALAALVQCEPDALELALEGARTAAADQTEQLWPHDVVVPELELAACALRREGIEPALERAIELHHHYYGGEAKDHFHGQLAVGPLALACFAHDLGLPTRAITDYAPRWIIERRAP